MRYSIRFLVVVVGLDMFASVHARSIVGDVKVEKTKVNMMKLEQALDEYKLQFAVYPTTEQGLAVLVEKQFVAGTLKDGWGRDFVYEGLSGGYKLTSYGADGMPGGSGLDQDLVKEI